MKMEKKMWSTPMAAVEQFVSDDYCVGTCYQIACSIGAQDTSTGVGGKRDDCCYHSHTKNEDNRGNKSGCGWSVNQNFNVVDNGDGTSTFRMKEINNSTYGTLDCYFYDPSDMYNEDNYELTWTGEFKVGQTILYWVTDVGYGNNTVWMHHQGVANYITASNPNRS